jgi:hypothetical protein
MHDPHLYWAQLSDSQKVYIYFYAQFLLHRPAFISGGILIAAGIIFVLL